MNAGRAFHWNVYGRQERLGLGSRGAAGQGAISTMLTQAPLKFRREPAPVTDEGDWSWYPRRGDVAIRRKTEKWRKCLIGATLFDRILGLALERRGGLSQGRRGRRRPQHPQCSRDTRGVPSHKGCYARVDPPV